jgi:UDPglucose 6-dehydrogenase
VARGLLEEHAQVVISDPKALGNARKDLKDIQEGVSFEIDPYKAAEGAHALAILTEWDLYRNLDYGRILKSMVHPAFLFDGRNILDHKRLFEMGFNVFPVGKAPMKHF